MPAGISAEGGARVQIGIDTFVETTPDATTGVTVTPVERVRDLLEEVELADQLGLDVYAIGEHHREEFVASAPAVLLAAAAARTTRIRLASSVTVLSSDDPVRVFQQFATVDLVSQGRAEIVVGRGSFTESYPLFGYDLNNYDALFAEKLELLLKLREATEVEWTGKFRAPLTGQAVYPRPLQNPLPIWLGVGGTPNSFARAGRLGLPLMVAIIGGEPHRFRSLVELYRESGRRSGFTPEQLKVGVHLHGFVAETSEQAADTLYPAHSYVFNKIGRERGWSPTSRAQFDAMRGPTGALVVGDPETVAEKLLYVHEALGGVARITLQLTAGTLPHRTVMRAIELLATQVAPAVRTRIEETPKRALAMQSA